MITILNILRHLVFNRFVWGTLCLIIAGLYLYNSFTTDVHTPTVKDYTDIITKIEQENPEKAAEIKAELSRYTPETLMVGYRFYQEAYKTNQLDEYCNDLAAKNSSTLACLRTIELVKQWKGKISEEQLQYLEAMAGEAVKTAGTPGTPQNTVALTVLNNYTDILEHAAREGGQTAHIVHGNSISAMIYSILCINPETASAKDWAYYSTEHEWMSDMLMLLMVTPPGDTVVSQYTQCREMSASEYLKLAIEQCERYPSMERFAKDIVYEWRQAVEQNLVANQSGNTEAELVAQKLPLLFEIYHAYGDVADTICKYTNRSADEVMNFLLLNEKELGEFKKANDEQTFIHVACSMLNETGAIEEHVQMQPHFLRLYYEVGADSIHQVMANEHNGFLYLLSAACSDEETGDLNADAARHAIDYAKIDFGHAFHVLNQFGHDPRFKHVIAKDKRMMMYLDRFPHHFEALTGIAWHGYVNKEINPDGTWKEHWVEYVPMVGATIKVGQNWVSGYPCTWSEIGWAAWEIGEGVALVAATIGTAGTATVAVKAASTATKTSIKTATTALTKGVVKGHAKGGVKKFVKTTFKKTLAQQMKSAAKDIPKLIGTAIVKGISLGKVLLRTHIPNALKYAGKGIKGLAASRKAMKAVALTMLGTELLIRTLPNIDKIAGGVGEHLGKIVKAGMDSPLAILTGMATGMAKEGDAIFPSFGKNLTYGIILLLIAMVIFTFPSLKRQYHKRLS